jgi:hypothetical protein
LRDFYLKICAGDGRLTRASRPCGKGKDHEMWRSHAHDGNSDDQVQSSSHEHDVAIVLFQAADLHDDHEMGFLEFATLAVTAAAAHEGGATAQVSPIWLLLLEVKHHGGRGGANKAAGPRPRDVTPLGVSDIASVRGSSPVYAASTLEVGDDCVHQEGVARLVRHCLALGVLDLDGGGGKSGGGKGGGHARAERVTAALFHDCDLGDGAEVSHELFHKKLGPFFRAAGARPGEWGCGAARAAGDARARLPCITRGAPQAWR